MDNKMVAGCAVIAILILAGILYSSYSGNNVAHENNDIKKFESLSEISNYLKNNVGIQGQTYNTRTELSASGAVPTAQKTTTLDSASTDFSHTNNQVEGVDEADIIKNDGKYIYTVSGGNIVIIDAYPAESGRIISQINMNNNSYAQEIFVKGNTLIVFGNVNDYIPYMYSGSVTDGSVSSGVMTKIASTEIARPYYYSPKMFVNMYDITDRSNPVLSKNMTIEGNYFDSRMIGDYVYMVSTKYIYDQNNVVLPMADGIREEASFPGVYYFENPDNSYVFSTIFAINMNNGDTTRQIFMLGSAQNMYVSNENIFITYTRYLSIYDYMDRYIDEVIKPAVSPSVTIRLDEIRLSNMSKFDKMNEINTEISNYANNLTDDERTNFYNTMYDRMNNIQEEIANQMEHTVIHKLSINGDRVEYKSNGEVLGHVLNQFSMDENNGYFRIATTTGTWDKPQNNVYVLDGSLNISGKLEGLASGEKIYSARFIGNRLYLVTFKNTDPLFVIDLSNPSSPNVLGELKIPGYSDYLHPYDETHIIGIGKDAEVQNDTNFAYYQGLKIALFDVSDVSNPTIMSNITIGDRGTQSDALYDHKAFLFSKSKNLLVIPVSLAVIDTSKYDGKIPSWAYGDTVWQGAYVFKITLEDGIQIRDRITHMDNITKNAYGYYDLQYDHSITRSLYINDVLYTLSDKMIKMNNLSDLTEINKIELPGYMYSEGPIVFATSGATSGSSGVSTTIQTNTI